MQWIQGQNFELQSELPELREKNRALEDESRALLEKNKEPVDQAEKERKVIVKFNMHEEHIQELEAKVRSSNILFSCPFEFTTIVVANEGLE